MRTLTSSWSLPLAWGLVAAIGTGCIASGRPLTQKGDGGGGAGGGLLEGGAGGEGGQPIDPGTSDPHAVYQAQPPHGPFTGGVRVLVSGKGFGPDVRVFFGDVEADPSTRVLIDAGRVQVTSPAHPAGPVDLTVQNGDDESTRRTLPGGYEYDSLLVEPSEGPVSGGTRIDVFGDSTSFDDATLVFVGNQPCTDLEVASPTVLACTVPPGTPGTKSVRVEAGGDTFLVLDAFTYEDSDNGFKGGLSGDLLNGSLRVLAYNNFTGEPIPGAVVIAGDTLDTAIIGTTNDSGLLELDDPSLVGLRSVTVAAVCHSPITFIDVPVDRVTAYLDPVLSPACGSGGAPPPVGGKSAFQGQINGELVWDGAQEFQKGEWNNVPGPLTPNEKRAAYVFTTTNNPEAPFTLPAPASAVTEESPGGPGYGFSLTVPAGNRTLYAVAGVEDRSVNPPKFLPYVMGVVHGVPVEPKSVVDSVFIPMRKTLDQALVLAAAPPAPGAKGPDRLRASVALGFGLGSYAILPGMQKTTLLPFDGTVGFGGLPSLDVELDGAVYVSSARAVTGQAGTAPLSVVGRDLANTTAYPVDMSGFVGLPSLVSPAPNAQWDGANVSVAFGSGAPVDLTVLELVGGGGLVRWVVAVPGQASDVVLPDLSLVPNGALPDGAIQVGVYGATIDDFDYGALRYRNLRPQGMTAYSYDTFPAFQ